MAFEHSALLSLLQQEWRSIECCELQDPSYRQKVDDAWRRDFRMRLFLHVQRSDSREQAALYIAGEQACITTLSNDFFDNLQPAAAKSAMALLPADACGRRRSAVFQMLRTISGSIRQTFPDLFHYELPLAKAELLQLTNEWARQSGRIRNVLRKALPDSTLPSVLFPQKLFPEVPDSSITYEQLGYAALYLRTLRHCTGSGTEPDEQFFLDALIAINHNERQFTHWVLKRMAVQIHADRDREQLIAHLSFLLKYYSQLPEISGTGFDPKSVSLKKLVVHWLEEEQGYFEHRPAGVTLAVHPTEALKIQSNLNVPQIGCLLRLFVESGLVSPANQTEMIGFSAQYLTTKRKAIISPTRLQVKYYNMHRQTLESIRMLLVEMMNSTKRPGF